MVMPLKNDIAISSGGLVNDADQIMHYVDDKVYFGGTAVKYNASKVDANGRPWVTLAGHLDRPIGYTLKSTYDTKVPYRYGVDNEGYYETDVETSIRRYREGDEISVPLCSGHAALVRGDKVGIRASGEFDKFSEISGCVYSIGIVQTPVALNSGSLGAAGINAECVVIRVLITKEV